MMIYVPLGNEQYENVVNFYLDYREFMTAQEMFIFEKVIKEKRVTTEEALILTRLQNELKNLK